jgi:hypothetical protein
VPRNLRIQYSGASYLVPNRGDQREAIFRHDEDRQELLSTLGEAWQKTIRIRWTAAYLIGLLKTVSRRQARTPLVICCFVAASCPALAQFSIARPNYGVPEFAEPGGTFRVEVKAGAGLANTLWSAVLVNDLRSWTGVVERAAYGGYVDNNTLTGYELKVRVPADISPEVFSLVISHPSGGAATNRNAVSIVPDLETDFYILHYADPQAEAYEPNNADTGMYGSHGSIREM